MDENALKPSTNAEPQNLSTEHQLDGDAKRPNDQLDKGQEDRETVPRKSSLT